MLPSLALKGQVTTKNNCLEIQNAMVPSTVLLASFDTDASAASNTGMKSHITLLNNHLNVTNA